MPIELIDEKTSFNQGTNIKVIGVGGGGCNAVEHMIATGVSGIEFICANTDSQVLKFSTADRNIQLGATGLGAGGKPEKGREAAEMAEEDIRIAIEGAQMLFITAGLGGGTGTGAAPVVAKVAKEMGILTVGVVTKPFEFEGGRRMKNANAGLTDLESHVDSLIVVLNDKLMDVMGDDISQENAFAHANDVLRNAVGGIAEIINVRAVVNVDFEDVRTVMGEPGRAMMGTAMASGPDRSRIAAEQAVVCPLLEGMDLSGAKGVLVLITATKSSLKLKETQLAMNTIRAFASPDAHVIFGTAYDEALGEQMRVTVVGTGLTGRTDSIPVVPEAVVKSALPRKPEPLFQHVPAMESTPVSHAPVHNSPSRGHATPVTTPVAADPVASRPAVWRPSRTSGVMPTSRPDHGSEDYEIPAYLRKPAN